MEHFHSLVDLKSADVWGKHCEIVSICLTAAREEMLLHCPGNPADFVQALVNTED